LLLSSILYAQEPQNLSLVKKQLVAYHDSGAYMADVRAVTDRAENYLLKAVQANHANKKLAVVFDIDETVISNYSESKHMSFGGTPAQIDKMTITGDKEPIIPVRNLYYLAKKHNVSIFFVTGRPESQRKITVNILKKAGYKGWKKLYLEPNNYRTTHKSAVPYKTSIRKYIESKGYHIIFSMGDQVSDFEGGYTQRGFKLPNPYYLIH
jgi:predicted secreted acid phosphatase